MKTLGLLMGTKTSFISDKYFKKNMGKLIYLDELNSKLFKYKEDVPYDYAIFCELKHIAKKKKINVIPLHGPTFNLKVANTCDYIFCIYEGSFSFMDNGIDGYRKYISILKRTKAKVFPSIEFQLFILNKNKYMKYLKNKGYDLIPTLFLSLSPKNNLKNIDNIYKFIDKNEYKEIIIKPELAGFASGFKHFKNISDSKLKTYLNKMNELNYKKLLVQPYIEEFLKYWEIKTYWLRGRFIYAYGTKVFGFDDDAIPVSQGGGLEDKLVKQCRKIGENIIKDIFSDFGEQIQLRIDFGCCIDNDNICREYFVNEIENCPTISDNETIKDNFRLLANNIINYIN